MTKQASGKYYNVITEPDGINIFPIPDSLIIKPVKLDPKNGQICKVCMKTYYLCNCK